MGFDADQWDIDELSGVPVGGLTFRAVGGGGVVEALARAELDLRQVQNGLAHLEALLPGMRNAVGTARGQLDAIARQLEPAKDLA